MLAEFITNKLPIILISLVVAHLVFRWLRTPLISEEERENQRKAQWKETYKELQKYNTESKKKAEEFAASEVNIHSFTVEAGKGADRGAALIEITWSGPEGSELFVAKSGSNSGLETRVEAVHRSDDRIGYERNKTPFRFTHRHEIIGATYHYYAWIEYPIQFEAYPIPWSSLDTDVELPTERTNKRENRKSLLESRSISIGKSETKLEFLQRKKEEHARERALRDALRSGKRESNPAPEFSTDTIVQQVLDQIKEEAELADKIDQTIETLGLDIEGAERLENEIIARYYEYKEARN